MRLLRFIVFVSGAVLMALEMLGSRILAPYFGNSIFVWGSLIGIFLLALSLGYYIGGRVSDRFPQMTALSGIIGLAGLLICIIPAVYDPLNWLIFTINFGPRLNPLLASLVLFAVPSILLGMVSPYAVRLSAKSVATVGNVAGILYAVSTGGSIFGTIATSFFLIPAFGVARIVSALGILLISTALLSGVWGRNLLRRQSAVVAACVAVILVPALYLSFGLYSPVAGSGDELPEPYTYTFGEGIEATVRYEKDSMYHHIRVEDIDECRYLRFDNSWQSGMYLDDPVATRFVYADFFYLASAFNEDISDILFIGLGGGSAPKSFHDYYPDARIDVVELDPEVVYVAREFFAVEEDELLNIIVADGRLYLERTDKKYDLIVLDAYYADSIPFHLTTVEFFRLAKEHLNPGGLIASNLIGAMEGPQSRLFRSMYRTYSAVFADNFIFPVYLVNLDPARKRNIILISAPDEVEMSVEELFSAAGKLEGELEINHLELYARSIYSAEVKTSDVPLLTDDHAPVDQLLYLYD